MKKFTKLALLSAVAAQLALVTGVSAVTGANDSETLALSGTIADTATVTVTNTSQTYDLLTSKAQDADTTGAGTVRLFSNGTKGFSLSISSASTTKFTFQNGANALAYKINLKKVTGTLAATNVLKGTTQLTSFFTSADAYDVAAAGNLTSDVATFLFTGGTGTTAANVTGPTDVTYRVELQYTANNLLPAGSYSDTLTFALTNEL